jgi:hypothetical protein
LPAGAMAARTFAVGLDGGVVGREIQIHRVESARLGTLSILPHSHTRRRACGNTFCPSTGIVVAAQPRSGGWRCNRPPSAAAAVQPTSPRSRR